MIKVTYRVEVTLDVETWDLFRRDTDFTFDLNQATRGQCAAGRGKDGPLGESYEWAEFHNKELAERCERDLLKFVAKYTLKRCGRPVIKLG